MIGGWREWKLGVWAVGGFGPLGVVWGWRGWGEMPPPPPPGPGEAREEAGVGVGCADGGRTTGDGDWRVDHPTRNAAN